MNKGVLGFVVLILFFGVPARTQEAARFALLIGNEGYAEKVGPLKNPHYDIDLVEAALTKLGFKVRSLKDADYKTMDTALKRHVREVNRAGPGAVSFFYYSGHGVANPETKINYLIPIDVKETEDERIWDEAFQQNVVIDMLSTQAPKATHFVVFDACRNELHITGPASKALGSDKGFVPVQTTPGLLIAYATAPGKTASDVGEGGGPYAKALSEEILKPGIEAVSMFRAVQIRVKQAINQDPWLSFPSLPELYLAGKPPPTGQGQPSSEPQPQFSEAGQAWAEVKDSRDPTTLEAFRKQFGLSSLLYDALAAERIAALNAEAKPPTQIPPTVTPSQSPPPAASESPPISSSELKDVAQREQAELKRLNCLSVEPDGNWGDIAQQAAIAFNRARPDGPKIAVALPSPTDLELLTSLTAPVCPKAPSSQTGKNDKSEKKANRDTQNTKNSNAKKSQDRRPSASTAARQPPRNISPSPSLGGGVGAGGF